MNDISLHLESDVPLAPRTTFGVGGRARFLARASSEAEVEQAVAWAEAQGLPLFVLGGGSNLLVRDEGFAGLVLEIGLAHLVEKDGGRVCAGAGVVWDKFVDFAVSKGLAGVECLAGIPGLVGGTPVQNVGAYGQEVSQTITRVRAYDRVSHLWVDLDNAACRFRYRESLFNVDKPGRYIVTEVEYALTPGGAPILAYAELARAFAGQATPSLAEVADKVREIRRGKGMLLVPGDADCRSAGSFFKNPIVSAGALERVATSAGLAQDAVPHWPAGEGHIKLPAAWLLEHAGFVKGYGEGPVGISKRHTLALVNRTEATFADVAAFEAEIVAAVLKKFGIRLTREPVVL